MAYGNNRSGEQPRAHFQLAGGSIIKFRHPYLIGQISGSSTLDEIDVSANLKLEGRYIEATQAQDSARQTVLIDGSTVTICNRLLNGSLRMPVIRTTGLVGSGDFVAALQMIKSIGDSVGGVLTHTEFINGKALTKVFYGVTPQTVPDLIKEGTEVPVYDIVLLYAGWIEAEGDSLEDNMKKIWAVGNSNGLEGYFSPYGLQGGSTKDEAMGTGNIGLPNSSAFVDNTTASSNIDNSDSVKAASSDPYSAYFNSEKSNSETSTQSGT